MYIAAAVNVTKRLVPAVQALHDTIAAKAAEWDDIVKIGRTHMQDATPITLGQEWSGYAGMLAYDLQRLDDALKGVYRLALGGTAVDTGINAVPGFAEAVTALAPVIGYDRASKIAHHVMDHDRTLKEAALQLGFVSEAEFDRVVDPAKMVRPYVAAAG